ncbi:hypothetical protein BHE74_00051416 [Ensete ventricosum]|uniref:Uncharacterized protein n=1 Tax=Ensete ventricosum TaxID=4639 RepID=A0A426YJ88_ENSVE|nr:hypothetical protein B296_00050937 [Ensete ventricosum]RWW33693.1 hypothetical protein GW17_00001577 [Ensete ventricosum]RWW42974.1 hypothetical protein BHE74_00051416 [Ensete ventricosum]RZR99688.1 hypothetical protein BHM03_00029273 [Ensete ventricosum]
MDTVEVAVVEVWEAGSAVLCVFGAHLARGIVYATRVPSRFRALDHSDLLVGGRFANSSPIRRIPEIRVLFHVPPVFEFWQ